VGHELFPLKLASTGDANQALPVRLGLLPDYMSLQQVAIANEAIHVGVITNGQTGCCPLCGHQSERVHSRYARKLADLPWHGKIVRLHVNVRRFFCGNTDCPRQIFAERLPALAPPHARTTARLSQAHCRIGFAVGGEPGARLASHLAMPTSPDTLLRRIR